mgnify:CR=1 FL=1
MDRCLGVCVHNLQRALLPWLTSATRSRTRDQTIDPQVAINQRKTEPADSIELSIELQEIPEAFHLVKNGLKEMFESVFVFTWRIVYSTVRGT